MRRLFILLFLLGLLLGAGAGAEQPISVTGLVFHDANGNGVFDPGEAGLEGVLVSDGRTVTTSALDGSYHLYLKDSSGIVFVTIPSGWWTDHFYGHVESGTGLDFALHPIPIAQEFRFIQVTDIHIIPQARAAVEEFVARVNGLEPQPASVISTGDLICYLTNLADTLDKVEGIVEGYNVQAALAGHWHLNQEREVGITSIITGALSGRWWGDDGLNWNGWNIDGSPQGFRVCRIEGGEFSSEYLSMRREEY